MDVYQYIAESPKSQQQAINLCQDYGLNPMDDSQLSDCLSDIVKKYGESGLKEVIKIHPDKEIILNYHIIPPSEDSQRVANMLVYKGANGDTTTGSNTQPDNSGNHIALQTNIIIFAAAVLIGFAIISKN